MPKKHRVTFDYRRGLERMQQVVKQVHPAKETQLQFLNLKAQLLENLRTTHALGTTQELTHDRNRIVGELNRLADQLKPGMSFTDLCNG